MVFTQRTLKRFFLYLQFVQPRNIADKGDNFWCQSVVEVMRHDKKPFLTNIAGSFLFCFRGGISDKRCTMLLKNQIVNWDHLRSSFRCLLTNSSTFRKIQKGGHDGTTLEPILPITYNILKVLPRIGSERFKAERT